MTRNSHAVAGVSWLALIAGLAWCSALTAAGSGEPAAASSSQSPSSVCVEGALRDAAITSKVKIKLLTTEALAGSSINVSTSDGIVRLEGMVGTAESVEEATQIAHSVEGVKAVVNQLSIPVTPNRIAARTSAPSSENSAPGALDSQINLKVRDKLLTDGELKNTQIGITTINGVVRLFGQVQTDAQRDRAALVARQVEGVKDVDSSGLTVSPGT